MSIGENIRRFRMARKLTQKELGELIGTTQQMIAQYENGKRNPKLETVSKIADALHTPIERFSDHTRGFAIFNISDFFDDNPSEKQELYKKLQIHYNSLNQSGKKEAVKRVEELTRLEEYTKPDPPKSAGSDASPLMSDQTAAGAPEDSDPAAEPNNDNSINPDKP